jgi:hypothetical protein
LADDGLTVVGRSARAIEAATDRSDALILALGDSIDTVITAGTAGSAVVAARRSRRSSQAGGGIAATRRNLTRFGIQTWG